MLILTVTLAEVTMRKNSQTEENFFRVHRSSKPLHSFSGWKFDYLILSVFLATSKSASSYPGLYVKIHSMLAGDGQILIPFLLS